MKTIEYDGIWWDPSKPETQWIGRLHFNRRDGATLRVVLPNDKFDLVPTLDAYDFLHGVTTDGKPVSLLKCFDKNTRGAMRGVPRALEIFANAVIVGFHCDNTNPLISSAAASFHVLREWWGQSGFSGGWPDSNSEVVLRHAEVPALNLYDNGVFGVTLRSVLLGSLGHHETSLREDVRFEVKAREPQPLRAFEEVFHACQDFLSISCLGFCSRDELTIAPAVPEGERKELGTFLARPFYKKTTKRLGNTLFTFRDIAERPESFFGAWLSNAERLESARALYFSGVYGQSFVEGKLLALTQAAEAFHRRFYQDLYMEPDTYVEGVYKPLKSAIPKHVPGPLRDALISRLKYGKVLALQAIDDAL